ncbi:DUF2442 domain-containing protein [Botrimarina sp.]|uniref:DUF2442 domain-containing protein n=1 Tax=Botrimarina sp. TaxID=2795802 RepID=UPI0032EE6773
MLRVLEARHHGAHRLWLRFSDGWSGVIDLSGRLSGPVFAPLTDPATFGCFSLTDHTIEWACGADLAPEYLRDVASETGVRDDVSSASLSSPASL